MFLKLLIITAVFVGIVILLLSVKLIFSKSGKFPQSSVGKNKEMSKRNIKCAKHEEIMCRREIEGKNKDSVCSHCG